MAHGVHLNKDDAELLRCRGTAVAHCPLSNFFFGDGVLATAKLVGMGVKVGLGSDVAGGYCPCMLSSIRNAVVAHRALRQGGRQSVDCLSASYKTCYERSAASTAAGNAHKRRLADMTEELDWRHAFNLATLGGAQALGIENEVGTIEAGKSFDAVLLDVAGGGIDLSYTDDSTGILEKLLNLGSERNVSPKFYIKQIKDDNMLSFF
jgi:guanine deaminase